MESRMTRFAWVPIVCRILHIQHRCYEHDDRGSLKTVGRRTVVFLMHYVEAEHDSSLFRNGDRFIIKEKY